MTPRAANRIRISGQRHGYSGRWGCLLIDYVGRYLSTAAQVVMFGCSSIHRG